MLNTIKALNKGIDKAIKEIKLNPSINRNELTWFFPKKVKIGINSITNNTVYIMDKDMSYFVYKYFRSGSLTVDDLKNISDVLNFDIVAINKDINDFITGYIFIKKSPIRNGYLDAITKKISNGEELFHYQYRNINKSKKLILKKMKNNMIIYDFINLTK